MEISEQNVSLSVDSISGNTNGDHISENTTKTHTNGGLLPLYVSTVVDSNYLQNHATILSATVKMSGQTQEMSYDYDDLPCEMRYDHDSPPHEMKNDNDNDNPHEKRNEHDNPPYETWNKHDDPPREMRSNYDNPPNEMRYDHDYLPHEMKYGHNDPPPPYPGLHLGQYNNKTSGFHTLSDSLQESDGIIDDQFQMTQDYNNQMKFTLCLLISCLLVCNFMSLIFTIPATIFAWKGARASREKDHQSAERNTRIAVVCNFLTFVQFTLVIFIFSILMMFILYYY